MNKKDRIAIVASLAYSIVPIGTFSDGMGKEAFALALPIFAYWGYRFIKGDISFLGVKDDQSQ